jgi:hypothetical protein
VGEASSSVTETLTIKVFGLKVGVVTCGRDWQLLASTKRVLSCLVLSKYCIDTYTIMWIVTVA